MPPADSYSEALSRVVDYIGRNQDEIVEEVDLETEEAAELDGFLVEHGGNNVLVLARPDRETIRTQFNYNVLGDALQAVAQTAFEVDPELSEGDDLEIEDHHLEQAQQNVADRIEGLSEDSVMKLRRKLVQLVSAPGVAYQLETLDGVRPIGFQTSFNIFWRSEGFTIERFHDGIQTILSAGIPGRMYLKRIYGFETLETESEDSGDTDDMGYDPTFQ